jgi:hypothetical protein
VSRAGRRRVLPALIEERELRLLARATLLEEAARRLEREVAEDRRNAFLLRRERVLGASVERRALRGIGRIRRKNRRDERACADVALHGAMLSLNLACGK